MNTDVSCLYDVVRKIAKHATTITAAPVTQSHSSQCHEYSGHQELMKIISADKCVSYTKVWGPLQVLGSQRHDCLVQAINHLAASYNHFDNRTCSCSHSGSDDLVFQNFHGAIMTNVLGTNVASRGSQGYCWTHQTLWSQLRLLAGTNTRSYCLTDLINHLALSTQRHTDTCSCHPVSVTSTPHTQHPVTVQPTSHPATAKSPITVQPCQKLETLIALAHNSYLVDNAVPCPSGGHSKAEATVVDLCQAPASISWRKGYNVLHHCHDIPQYTAVASFAGNLYHGDGVSGILISCNTTSLRIATERCDHPIEVVTVVTGARDQYTHMADNYYTIHW
ncbi:hypothetical protein KP79_PYT24627 [Mizuhopecten yessoensis]|uniref:Uncharacterized protein n=1 Tax=Mizuhopecten yessoensis TaxID=6573 RepID=A0A210Q566_MIZYE|nr:hypothetical protein KP79_PYT24627 [Mizuhopecten yessoensis]